MSWKVRHQNLDGQKGGFANWKRRCRIAPCRFFYTTQFLIANNFALNTVSFVWQISFVSRMDFLRPPANGPFHIGLTSTILLLDAMQNCDADVEKNVCASPKRKPLTFCSPPPFRNEPQPWTRPWSDSCSSLTGEEVAVRYIAGSDSSPVLGSGTYHYSGYTGFRLQWGDTE